MKKLIFSLALLAITSELSAQDSLGMQRMAALNYWNYWWSDIEVVGNIAYITAGVSGLHLMDFSNPEESVEIATYDSVVSGVSVSGNRAYVTAPYSGVVYDVSDPPHPQEIGQWYGNSGRIFVHGDVGIVTDEDDSCPFVLDVADPESVYVVDGLLAPCYAQPVGVAGGYFGLIGFMRGFRLFDLSTPEQPMEVSSIFPTSSFYHATIVGNYAYIATGYAGLRIIDLTNPLQPVHVATCDSGNGVGNCVTISGDHAIIGKDSSVDIWNVANPVNPVLEGSFATDEPIQNVHAWGNFVYIPAGYSSLTAARIIDISNPSAPVEVGSFGNRGDLWHMTIRDNLGYVADRVAGLRIVDLSDPAEPVELGHTGMGNFCCFEDVTVRGNYAYLAAENSGIVTVDVSNPAAPTVLSGWHPSYDTYWPRILAVGDYVYVADDNAVIYTFGLTNPTSPELADTLHVGGWGRFGLAAYDNYLCAVNWDGFHMLSLVDPAAPELVGSLNQEMGREIAISGHYAFVGGEDVPTRIVELANPAEPTLVGVLPSQSRAVAARGTILITKSAGGLNAWNISDPVNPQLVGFYTADEGSSYPWIDDVKILGAYVVTAAGHRLRTYACDALLDAKERLVAAPLQFALHPCYPNPFNAVTEIRFDLPQASHVELTIFNTLGQRVATLVDGARPAGAHHANWNANDVASGLYAVQLRAGDYVDSKKVLLLK